MMFKKKVINFVIVLLLLFFYTETKSTFLDEEKLIIRSFNKKTYFLDKENDILTIKSGKNNHKTIDLNKLPYEPPIKLKKKRNIQDFMITENGYIWIIDSNIGGIIILNIKGEYLRKVEYGNTLLKLWKIDRNNLIIIENNLMGRNILHADSLGNIIKKINLNEKQEKNERGIDYFNEKDIFTAYSIDQENEKVMIYSNYTKILFEYNYNNKKITKKTNLSKIIDNNCYISYINKRITFFINEKSYIFENEKLIEVKNPLAYTFKYYDNVEKDKIFQFRNGVVNEFKK